MQERFAEIGADGVDVDKIMQKIERTVTEKEARGVYKKHKLNGIGSLEIKELKDSTEILGHVVNFMKKSCEIDISDFEIVNKGGLLGRVEVAVKKVVWKLLKFYTYRMFMQQREFNARTAIVLNGIWNRLRKLEERVRE